MLVARIAWRNLWRHRRRTLITASAMAVGAALCMAMSAFSDGMYRNLFDVMVVQQLGHVQVHHPDHPTSRSIHDALHGATALMATIDGLPGTSAASGRLEGFALLGTERKSSGALLIGVDPKRETAISPLAGRVRAGTFLPDAPAGAIVLGYDLADDLAAEIGTSLVAVTQAADGSLGNTLFNVVGIVKTGNVQIDKMGAYVHLAEAQDLLVLPDQLHTVTIVTDDERTVDDYVARLSAALGADAGANRPDGPVEVQAWYDASPQAAQLMGMRDFGAFIMLGIVFGAAAFGVLNTMMMSVFERTRELGVLKAIGLRPASVVSLILWESVSLAALSLALGLGLGGLLDAYLVVYGFDMSGSAEEGFSFSGVMIDPVIHGEVRALGIVSVVVATVVVSVLASLWPAVRASRLDPVAAMRAE